MRVVEALGRPSQSEIGVSRSYFFAPRGAKSHREPAMVALVEEEAEHVLFYERDAVRIRGVELVFVHDHL